MAKSQRRDEESDCKKYGLPLYGAAWIPSAALKRGNAKESESESPLSSSDSQQVVLAGGGGEGSSGIANALLISGFDFDSISLSDQPVGRLGTGSDVPYRIAVHPGGEGLICSLPKSCRWYEWDTAEHSDDHTLRLKSSSRTLELLEDVGQQLAITFDSEGSLLAVGGEDGKLRVFRWPAMESFINEANAHTSVKDLDFSPDGKFLVSVGSGSSPGRIWNTMTSTCIATLKRGNEEIFAFCRFSRSTDGDQILYITVIQDRGASIVKWNTTSWERISSTRIVRDPVSAFNVSPNGKFLAVGTIQGDISIINSASMRVLSVVRKAHLGLVTALAFSQDSRALVSASLDSSVRVTLIKDKKEKGMRLWIVLFVILLAAAVFYAKSKANELLV